MGTFLPGRAQVRPCIALSPTSCRLKVPGQRYPHPGSTLCKTSKLVALISKSRSSRYPQNMRFRRQVIHHTYVLLKLRVRLLLPGPGWGKSFLDLPKHDCRDAGGRAPKVGALGDAGAVAEGRFGRVYREVLATCLRKTYPAPDPPTNLKAPTYPPSTIFEP
jgi:hypothetical protein